MAQEGKRLFNVCVKVYEASDFASKNVSSLVCVQVRDDRKYTSVVKFTDRPHYNEYFVFDLFVDMATLMDTVIMLSVFESRTKYRPKKLIGCVSLDVATVWIRQNRLLKAWFTVAIPSDVFFRHRGKLRCEINVEAPEGIPQPLPLSPMEPPDVLGSRRAKYIVKIYHCDGLEVRTDGRTSPDVCVRVSFAGRTGSTTNRPLRESAKWNEQLTFIELFPPTFQKITLELFVGKKIITAKHFQMADISTTDYSPTYGPTYLHLYVGKFAYQGSLMLAIDTEVLASFSPSDKFHQVTMLPTAPVNDRACGPCETFLCYGVLFDAALTDKRFNQNYTHLSLSFGKVGVIPVQDTTNNTITDKYKAVLGNADFVYLPINECKPCVFLQSEWPNTRHRLYNSNILETLADNLRERVSYAEDLIVRGDKREAKILLNTCLKTVVRECTKIPRQLSGGLTKLDAERAKVISVQLKQLASTAVANGDVYMLLEKCNFILTSLDTICVDVQDSLPSILLSLKKRSTVIGSCKVHPRQVIFSETKDKRGSGSGKITSFFLKDEQQNNVGRLDIWLWLGFWDEVSHCLRELPPGHEDLSAAVSLPSTITYNTDEMYCIVCHVFGGNIDYGVDREGLRDTSVRILVANQCRWTKTATRSLTPLWKENLVFSDVRLYPTPAYVQRNPPALTVELWDYSAKYSVLMSSAFVYPRVRLHPFPKTTEYSLQWTKLDPNSQILGVFEIIQMPSGETRRMSEIIPQFLEPPTTPYKLEVVFWGIRPCDTRTLRNVNKPQAIIHVGEAELESNVITRPNTFANFQHNLLVCQLNLPETSMYLPPMILRVVSNNYYVGGVVDKNIQRFLCHLPKKKDWTVLSTLRKSMVDRALSRHSSVHDSIPDLIPLLDVNPTRRSTQGHIFYFLNKLQSLKTAITKVFDRFKIKIDIPGLAKEENEECDWWDKYFSSKIQVYKNELEDQPEFNGFSDVLKAFEIKQQKSGVLEKVAVVKAMVCLYEWPTDVPVVTPRGLDPETGVLQHTEMSDRAKILVRVYCIRAHDLRPYDSNNKSDPYIEIATSSTTVSDRSNYIPKQLNPMFGRHLEIIANLPMDSVLTVRVMDWDRVSAHDLIGETFVDIENRYFSKHRATCGLASAYSKEAPFTWRDVEKPTDILERLCNNYNLPLPQYYEKSVLFASKEFSIKCKNTGDVEETQEQLALSALHRWNEVPIVGMHLVPEHVETRTLYNKARPGIEQGKLELWVDLFDLSLGEVPPPVDITPHPPEAYELRVVILNTSKVPLVDNSYFVGRKHTDIYVKGWLGDTRSAQSTDIHYTSINGEGKFNWRFKFPFIYHRAEKRMVLYKKAAFDIVQAEYKVPALLHLQVWDNDKITKDDFIGSMVLELCCMPQGARSRWQCKVKDTLAPSQCVDLFKVKRMRGWWPFLKSKSEEQTSGGFLEAEFQLLTAEEALTAPAGLGRSEPSALPPPIRPEIMIRFWLAPFRVLFHLICGEHRGKCILCILTFAVVLFFLVGIYSAPIFIAKKILDLMF